MLTFLGHNVTQDILNSGKEKNVIFIILIKLSAHILKFFMLAIAGQTAGPYWLKFFEGTHGYPGVT